MKRSVVAIVTVLFIGLVGITGTQASCLYDVVGNTQTTPTIELTPDGQVTYGMANWWEDDILACYQAHRYPVYLPYFGGCDRDGSGLVEIEEVREMYEFVIQYPSETGPAYAYSCSALDPDEIEYTASGVCTEMNGIDGPNLCPETQLAGIVQDMNYILEAYPFTEAVFQGIELNGGGQAFAVSPYGLICATNHTGYFDADLFDDLNAAYNGTTQLVLSGSMVLIKFAQGVNIEAVNAEYHELVVASFPEGFCDPDGLFVGEPTGFHAEHANQAQPDGWVYHEVNSTADCDYYGCRCDATVGLWTNAEHVYYEDLLVNDSGPLGEEPYVSGCTDPRFDF